MRTLATSSVVNRVLHAIQTLLHALNHEKCTRNITFSVLQECYTVNPVGDITHRTRFHPTKTDLLYALAYTYGGTLTGDVTHQTYGGIQFILWLTCKARPMLQTRATSVQKCGVRRAPQHCTSCYCPEARATSSRNLCFNQKRDQVIALPTHHSTAQAVPVQE